MKMSIRGILSFFCLAFIPQLLWADINQDLEIEKLYTQINQTATDSGAREFYYLLLNPTSNRETLKNRQHIIAHIIENNDLYAQLSTTLQAFATHEKHLNQLLQPETKLEAALLENFYFSHDYFRKYNHNPLYLELGQVGYLANLCSSLVQHGLAFAIFTWGLEEEHTCAVHPPKKHKHHHKKHDHNHDHGHHACKHHHHHSKNFFRQLAQSPSFRYIFQAWHAIAQIQELYAIQSVVRNHFKTIGEMQAQLMQTAQAIDALRQVQTILDQHPEISSRLQGYAYLKNVCLNTHLSHNLTTCLNLLQSKTFTGAPSVFSRIGTILATYKLLQDIGHELLPALNAIGEIDAYLSCAQLMQNHAHKDLRYSFANYVTEKETPFFSANNLWHPLSAAQTIQANSIDLGSIDTPRNIIITGPNASGKSTNLKAITLCAYLAQTITIVPAQEHNQTIFKEIYSSMIVTDKMAENMSLFVAELHNAEQLLNRVENLKENEYMLIALDELFKSTRPAKGQIVAYELLKNLYQSPNVVTLTSTHFENLTTLADVSDNNCANYTLDNFKLIPGIGECDKTFDIVRAQFRGKLID